MSNYTILIICEGEKTEPLFFNSIRDELIDGKYNNNIRKITLKIAPEPHPEDENETSTIVRHKPKRKKRRTKKVSSIDNDETEINILSGQPPLRWVLTAKENLKNGAYDEVWAVFDSDNHPAKQEAFDEADKEVNGKKVNIAYSSRSFEYYLLLHFEKIYNKFNNTDCKQNLLNNKDKFVRCGTNIYPEFDCNGEKCINGYAQTSHYWNNSDIDNTKKSKSTFLLIKDRLVQGFINSSWIRYKSDILENKIAIYDRNPYTSLDLLVKNLTDDKNNYIWISINEEYITDKIRVKIKNKHIVITNISNKTIIFKESSIFAIFKSSISLNQRRIMNIEEDLCIDISKYISKGFWFKIEHENHILMIENEARSSCPS